MVDSEISSVLDDPGNPLALIGFCVILYTVYKLYILIKRALQHVVTFFVCSLAAVLVLGALGHLFIPSKYPDLEAKLRAVADDPSYFLISTWIYVTLYIVYKLYILIKHAFHFLVRCCASFFAVVLVLIGFRHVLIGLEHLYLSTLLV